MLGIFLLVSKYLYISFYYFNQRLRLPTDKEDTPANRAELTAFMNGVGEKIKLRIFQFSKTFFWVDEKTKKQFTALEGGNFTRNPST